MDEKFAFDFSSKKEILDKIGEIENVRNKLCYGKRVEDEEELEKVVLDFNLLKKIFLEVTNYEL